METTAADLTKTLPHRLTSPYSKCFNRVPIVSVHEKADENGGLSLVGETLVVGGWVKTGREADAGKILFLEVNDGSTPQSLQVVVSSEIFSSSETSSGVSSLADMRPTGTSVVIEGEIKLPPETAKGQVIELHASRVLSVGKCDASTYPIAKKKQTLEYLRDKIHMRPRTNTIQSIARVRNALAFATHEFFNLHGFCYVHTPLITKSDCEGAGEMFQVTTLLGECDEEDGKKFTKSSVEEAVVMEKRAETAAIETKIAEMKQEEKPSKSGLKEQNKKLEQAKKDLSIITTMKYALALSAAVLALLDSNVNAIRIQNLYTNDPEDYNYAAVDEEEGADEEIEEEPEAEGEDEPEAAPEKPAEEAKKPAEEPATKPEPAAEKPAEEAKKPAEQPAAKPEPAAEEPAAKPEPAAEKPAEEAKKPAAPASNKTAPVEEVEEAPTPEAVAKKAKETEEDEKDAKESAAKKELPLSEIYQGLSAGQSHTKDALHPGKCIERLNITEYQMVKELEYFSRNLEKQHFDNALFIWKNLTAGQGLKDRLMVHTWELYDQSFTFPRVRRYQFVMDNMDMLEHFEDNLNQNIDNSVNLANFLRVATTVRNNLNFKYGNGGGFEDPANFDPYEELEPNWATTSVE